MNCESLLVSYECHGLRNTLQHLGNTKQETVFTQEVHFLFSDTAQQRAIRFTGLTL